MSPTVALVAVGAHGDTAVGNRIGAFARGLSRRGWCVTIIDPSLPGTTVMERLLGHTPTALRAILENAGVEGDVRHTPPLLARVTRTIERRAVCRAAAVAYAGGAVFGNLLIRHLRLPPTHVIRLSNGFNSADIEGLSDAQVRPERKGQPLQLVMNGYWYGLAVQVLLALLDARNDNDPVPVWLSLTDWGAGRRPDTEAPELREWLVSRLYRDARMNRDAARQLVNNGGILPVLDGLDELPEHTRIEIVAALNRSSRTPVILISRTEEYASVIVQGRDVLTTAAVIEAKPLTPVAAVDYLRASLRPGPGPEWDKVLTALRSATPPAALAAVASTPLGLWLLRETAKAWNLNPVALTNPNRFPSAEELRAHLFDLLIPALLDSRPPGGDRSTTLRPRRRHDPGKVRERLARLAHYLGQSGPIRFTPVGYIPGTRDFRWWILASVAMPRYVLAGMFALVGVALGVVAGGVVGLSMNAGAIPGGPVNVLTLRVVVLTGGVAVGIAVAFWLLGWNTSSDVTSKPTTPYASWCAARTGAFVWLAIFALGGAALGASSDEARWSSALPYALVGLTVGVLTERRGVLIHLSTIGYLAARGRMPLQLMAFLDDAHRIGLLRAVGPIYQFRHAEFQEHLAASSRPVKFEPTEDPRQDIGTARLHSKEL